jgi:cytochrome oxidase Cu insertion factor (SCO1/SenC/PrrC family)
MKISPRVSLVIIAAMFLLPLLLAWFMYSGTIEYKPPITRNFGQLVKPPIPLDWQEAILLPGDDEPGQDAAEAFSDHWVILYPVPDPCLDTCLQAALALRQIHRAAGRQQARIRIALLIRDKGSTDVEFTLRDTYSRFQLIRDPDGKLTSTLQRATVEPGAVYLIDPLGNIMMTYKEGADPNELKQDLKRLLTWSKLDT